MAERSLSVTVPTTPQRRAIVLRAALTRVMDHSAGTAWQIAAEALANDDKMRLAALRGYPRFEPTAHETAHAPPQPRP